MFKKTKLILKGAQKTHAIYLSRRKNILPKCQNSSENPLVTNPSPKTFIVLNKVERLQDLGKIN